MIKKISLVVLSLVLVQNILFAAQPLRTADSETAANFTLLDLDNKQFSLADFKDKPVILFFWTTWCPHCQKEIRLLNSMHTELLNNGIELIAVNVEESADRVQKLTGSNPFSYRILLDSDGKVAEAYGILGVPTYIFINKQNRIVFNDHGFPRTKYKDIILK